VTEPLELLAGARYSWDKQVYDQFEVSRNITQGVGTQVAPLAFTGVAKSTALTGKLGVNYHVDNNTLIYLTASKGYKAGGVNLGIPTVAVPVIPNFAPEKNFVYELGAKTEFFDRHVRVNGDVFLSRYKDIQFASLFNGLPLTQNAASGKSKGAELEVTGQFGGLSFNGGVGYLDAKFAKNACINNTNNPAGTPALCGGAANEFVPAGRVLPLSPKWTINAGAQYQIGFGDSFSVTPRLQWSYLSRQLATPFPSLFTVVPARSVVDGRVTFDIGQAYRLEAYVTNLTDKTYIASQIQNASSANGGYIYGAPRQYGLRGTWKF
jgi:iron complex outermembrane receptor protein